MAVLLLLVSTLAASPALHKQFHTSANVPGHDCVITALAKGQVQSATGALVLVAFVALIIGVIFHASSPELPTADYRYSASRAPPASLLP